MAPQALSFDILLLILEVSPVATAARMTRTCHTLRRGGTRYLLDCGVSLTSGAGIASFLQFLYADATTRFQHFHTLELACGKILSEAAVALLGLIAHPLLTLGTLTLREPESILKSSCPSLDGVVHNASHPPLLTALAGLTTLQHLTVCGHCGRHTCALIDGIRLPLKTVSMDFVHFYGLEDLLRQNPILTLAKHSGTLEKISGSGFAVFPGSEPSDNVFPSVRTLSTTFLDSYFPETLTLVAAFPNLTRLSLTASVTRHATLTGPDLSRRLERAAQNGRDQREQQEMRAPEKMWAKLEELEGTLADILALGLRPCHISMLRLLGTLSETPEYEYIKTVLEDTRPAGLAITMAMTGASTFGDTIGPVFRDSSAQQLCALEIELIFSASKGDVEIQGLLVRSS